MEHHQTTFTHTAHPATCRFFPVAEPRRSKSRRRRGHRAGRDGGPIVHTWSERAERAAHARIQPPSTHIPCVQRECELTDDGAHAGEKHTACRRATKSRFRTRYMRTVALRDHRTQPSDGPHRVAALRLPLRCAERRHRKPKLSSLRSSGMAPIVRGTG